MLRLRLWAALCGFLALTVLGGRAQDTTDLKAILKKAIEAHGGEKNLAKYQGSVSKFKGTILVNKQTINVTGETSFQKPDKLKNVMMLDINNKALAITQVYNGKKFWISVGGNTMEINDEKVLNEARESLLVEGAVALTAFLEKPYELNFIGEVKVKGKEALGIRISKKGQRDFSLYFDKKTHLVVKTEMRALDLEGGAGFQEITQEKYLSDYRDKQGLKMPGRVEVHKDGVLFMDIELTEVNPVERLDDAVFAKP